MRRGENVCVESTAGGVGDSNAEGIPFSQGVLAWLSLGNILHFCFLWFSGKSPLSCC